MLPLGLLSEGENGEIVAVRHGEGSCCGSHGSGCCGACRKEDSRVEDMGLRIGKTVEMLANGGGGPLLLRVDESRIAVARGLAMKIMVRR